MHKKNAKRKRRLKFDIENSNIDIGLGFTSISCGPGGKPAAGAPAAFGPTFSRISTGPLANIQVNLVFWGGFWKDNPLGGQVVAAIQNLMAGPYMTHLAQYGVHRGIVRGVIWVTDSEPQTPFNTGNVGTFVIDQIDKDNLPEPDDGGPNLYAVIMPPTSTFVTAGITGVNGTITWKDYDLLDVDNDPAHFCWSGCDASLNFTTRAFSHELVEAVTDPDSNGVRWIGCPQGKQSCQIADPCQSMCDFVHGVNAWGYWSEIEQTCVVPTMYSIRRTLDGKSIGGKIPRPTPSVNAWITTQF
jgi:hypothetical protein